MEHGAHKSVTVLVMFGMFNVFLYHDYFLYFSRRHGRTFSWRTWSIMCRLYSLSDHWPHVLRLSVLHSDHLFRSNLSPFVAQHPLSPAFPAFTSAVSIKLRHEKLKKNIQILDPTAIFLCCIFCGYSAILVNWYQNAISLNNHDLYFESLTGKHIQDLW